jgi:hypothetical protein
MGCLRNCGRGAGDSWSWYPAALLLAISSGLRLLAVGREVSAAFCVCSAAGRVVGRGAVSTRGEDSVGAGVCGDCGIALCALFREDFGADGVCAVNRQVRWKDVEMSFCALTLEQGQDPLPGLP